MPANLSDNVTYKKEEVFGSAIDEATGYIYTALNSNDKGFWWVVSVNDSVQYNQIKNVLKSYINIILENPQLPAFYDDKHVKNAEMQSILSITSQKSGVALQLTGRILKQLYWAVLQNNIKSNTVLKPREAVANYQYRIHNSDIVGNVSETVKTILDSLNSIAKGAGEGVGNAGKLLGYLPYILLAGGIAYGAYFILSIKKMNKETTLKGFKKRKRK